MQDQGLDWGKCAWLCIDRIASMAGYHLGAITKKKLQRKICCLYIAVNI